MPMSRMELSSVYNRTHYLVALKNAQWDDKITMLRNITPEQLDYTGEIAHRIYDQTFPLLVQDLGYFDDRSLVLGFLFADRVSFCRKKATFVYYHSILRTYYLQATIQDQISSQRES